MLTINGKERSEYINATVEDMLIKEGHTPAHVVVEINYEIPERGRYGDLTLKDGDIVEVVTFMGGG